MSISDNAMHMVTASLNGGTFAEQIKDIKAYVANPLAPDAAALKLFNTNWHNIYSGTKRTIEGYEGRRYSEEEIAYAMQKAIDFPVVVAARISGEFSPQPMPRNLCVLINLQWYSLYHVMKSGQFALKNNVWSRVGAPLGKILEYNANPLDYLSFKQLPHEKPGQFEDALRYYGVELEVNSRKAATHAETCKKVHEDIGTDFAILKFDRSTGELGFEIVTAPATLAYHRQAWEKFFAGSASLVSSWENGRCGMHVHISRAAFQNPSHLSKMMAFYNAPINKDFIERIAGRQSEYAIIDPKANVMVAKMLGIESNKGEAARPINATFKAGKGTQKKYSAVNLQHTDTVEVRIFKGNVSKIGFFKNLEFVDAVMEYSKVLRYNSKISEAEKKLRAMRVKNGAKGEEMDIYSIHFKDFLTWLEKDKTNSYTCLRLWLHKIGLLTSSGINVKALDAKTKAKVLKENNGVMPIKHLTDVEIMSAA